MFEGLFQPMHLLVIFAIALLVFGPRRLPELGKGLGEAIRGFKSSLDSREMAAPTPARDDAPESCSTSLSSDSLPHGSSR
jgi:sec-independent protein translocase protein TatA